MLLGIDHLVIAVRDLDDAADELERRVGLAATGGGRHPTLGTQNRLAWLGDTYLELVSIADRSVAEGSWLGVPTLAALERGDGLATWAIATDSIDADVEALRAIGSGFGESTPGERLRPDGAVVRWRLAIGGALGPAEPWAFLRAMPIARVDQGRSSDPRHRASSDRGTCAAGRARAARRQCGDRGPDACPNHRSPVPPIAGRRRRPRRRPWPPDRAPPADARDACRSGSRSRVSGRRRPLRRCTRVPLDGQTIGMTCPPTIFLVDSGLAGGAFACPPALRRFGPVSRRSPTRASGNRR